MAVLKQIKFGDSISKIQFTEVKPASGGVITATPSHTDSGDENNPEYAIDLTIANDGTLVKENNALKVGTVPAAQVSVAEGTGLKASDAQTAFKELKDSINAVGGAAKSYKIIKETSETPDVTLDANVLEQYKLQQTVNGVTSIEGETIKIYKDSSLKKVVLNGQSLDLTSILADGTESTVGVDVSTFLAESEFANGLQVIDHVVSVKIDPTSEAFLTVGKGGVKLAGVQNAINSAVSTAVEGLDFDDTAKAGQYVSKVSETDGKIAVERANVSDAVLNGYAKGEKPTSTAIAATDDVEGALAKLEHQVDAAKAAATTKVAEGTDAGNNMEIVSTKSDTDGSTTYTINLTDVASDAALDAEIAARKDADVKLDAALKAEADRAKSAETSIDAAIGLTKGGDNETRTYANTGEYIGKGESKTVASDIKALDTKLKEVADGLAAVPAVQYQVNGTTLEFFGISEKTV